MLGKSNALCWCGAVSKLVLFTCCRVYLFDRTFCWFLVSFTGSVAFVYCWQIFALCFTLFHLGIKSVAKMAAMQLTFFFFLPSLLLSGFFMFLVFAGMPQGPQWLGGILLTHPFLRNRARVMLNNADWAVSI